MGVRPVVLGVAGGSGSGKSTVVREVVRIIGEDAASVIHHDAYYRDLAHLPLDVRARVNFDHPDALETELVAEQLATLMSGGSVEVPTYDFSTHTRRRETVTVHPTPVVILDGILVLAHAELRDLMDLKVFVDTDADVRLIRRVRRDTEERGRTAASVIEQYERTVRPMHLQFVEPSRRYADMTIPEGGFNRVAVDLLVTRIRTLMNNRHADLPYEMGHAGTP